MSPKPRKATVPAHVALPKDRLGKMPREKQITVPLDDTAVETLHTAHAALVAATARVDAGRARRVNQLRAADLTAEQAHLEATIDAQIDTELDPLRAALSAAEQAVKDTSRGFTFRAIGRAAYQALLEAHPAHDEDHEDVRSQGIGQKAAYHAETFAPALVQASAVDPPLADEDVAAIFSGDSWNHSEVAQLFMAALEVNTQRRVIEIPT